MDMHSCSPYCICTIIPITGVSISYRIRMRKANYSRDVQLANYMNGLFIQIATRFLYIIVIMHILFATEYLPPYVSGISNRCKNLINGYRASGHTVSVYSVEGTDCDVAVPSIPNPFYAAQRFISLLVRTFCSPPLSLLFELLDLTKPVPYDICHIVAPLCFSFLWLLPLLKLRGVKIYVSYHVYLEYYFKAYFSTNPILLGIATLPFVILYFLPLVWLADCVGIPSATADNYVFNYSRKIHILKSGLDTSVFNPNPKRVEIAHGERKMIQTIVGDSDHLIENIRDLTHDNLVMIYAGRLAPEKNIEFLISSLGHPSLSNVTLVIVGDGPIRGALEKLAVHVVGVENIFMADRALHWKPAASSRISRVVFTGMIMDEYQVARFYSQSDVFVSASASETFGFTVAEAMGCGTPAVVVRSGAFETVYKVISDWMFTINDHDDFAAKILTATASKMSRQRARKLVLHGYSIEQAIVDFLDTYSQLIHN